MSVTPASPTSSSEAVRFHVLIPAAGAGSRMQSATPKQYLPLLGRPLIAQTLQVFLQEPRIASISVVLSADDEYWQSLMADQPQGRVTLLRCGGASRADTVLNGLHALRPQVPASDWMLVHDAARPCLSVESLTTLLDSVQHDAVGGLLAIPLADTLKRAGPAQRVARTEPRDGLWQAQTPQMFRYALLTQALQAAAGAPTDEAQAVEALGYQPLLVPGQLRNLKITYPQDMQLAQAILQADQAANPHTEKEPAA